MSKFKLTCFYIFFFFGFFLPEFVIFAFQIRFRIIQIDSKKLQAAPNPLMKTTISQAAQAQAVQAQAAQAQAAQQHAYTAAQYNAVNGMRAFNAAAAAASAAAVPQQATGLTNYAVAAAG